MIEHSRVSLVVMSAQCIKWNRTEFTSFWFFSYRSGFHAFKVTTFVGKIQGQKLFRRCKQGSSESLFVRKKFWELVAL